MPSAYGTRLTVRDSSVSNNESRLWSDFPSYLEDGTYLDMLAKAGGIHVSDDSPVVITGSRIDGNTTSIEAPNAEWGAIDAGLLVTASPLVMRDSSVSHDRLEARLLTAPGGPGSAFEWDGTADISGCRFVGNVSEVTALDGVAGVSGAVAPLAILYHEQEVGPSTVRDSVISDNLTRAISPRGSAYAQGAGLFNDSPLTLEKVLVTRNQAVASSRGTTAWLEPAAEHARRRVTRGFGTSSRTRAGVRSRRWGDRDEPTPRGGGIRVRHVRRPAGRDRGRLGRVRQEQRP